MQTDQQTVLPARRGARPKATQVRLQLAGQDLQRGRLAWRDGARESCVCVIKCVSAGITQYYETP